MTEVKRKKTSVILNEGLWRRFKASTAAEGVEMSVTLENLIAAYLHNHAIRN